MSTEATISRLKIVTETDAEDAVNGLRRLASALSFLKEAQKGSFANLSRIATNIQTLADTVKGINNKDIDKLERMAGAIAKLNGVKMSMTRLGKFARLGAKADEIREKSGGTGKTDTIRDRGGEPTTLPPEEKKDDKTSKKAEKQEKSRLATLFASLKRIAVYRLIRSALKAITQAFQEGFQNAKEWSRINNTQLYQSFKNVSAGALAMKNALGAASGELLITLEPLITRLAIGVANLGNSFANLFAVLGGRSEYQKAITDIKKLAEAQERLNRALLGFDEINKLNGGQNVSDYFTMEKTNTGEAAVTGTLTAAAIAALVASKLIPLLKGGTAAAGAGAAGAAGAAGTSVLSGAASVIPYVAFVKKDWVGLEGNPLKSNSNAINIAKSITEKNPWKSPSATELAKSITGKGPWSSDGALSVAQELWGGGAAEIVIKEQTPSGYEKEVARFTYGDIINNRVGRIMVNTSMTR